MQGRRVVVLLLLALVVIGCSGGSAAFETPDEAITYYLEGVVESDVDKMLEACAIDEMSEDFQFELYAERLGWMFLPFTSLSPTDYPLYVEANRMEQTSRILGQARNLLYSLLSSDIDPDSALSVEMDEEKVDDFVKDVNPKGLRGLEVEEIDLPNRALMEGDQYQKSAAGWASVYGADEMTERVVLVSFDDDYYLMGFTLLRYGKNWKIAQQYSPIGGTPGFGTAEKITVDEYESMINSP